MEESFGIKRYEIDNIFRVYQFRIKNEEVDYINSSFKGIKDLAKKLKTDLNKGISKDSLELRKRVFGTNELYRAPLPKFTYFVKDAFGDEILRKLFFQSIFGIIINLTPFAESLIYDTFEGLGVLFIIMIITLITALINYNKEKICKNLIEEDLHKFKVIVIRDGAKMNLSSEELLVGDICIIEAGMIVPADGIIIASSYLKIDEYSITGEKFPKTKESIKNCLKVKNISGNYPSPIVFSGTTVKEGEGKMLVLATGSESAEGKIREHKIYTEEEDETKITPSEMKLINITKYFYKLVFWIYIIIIVTYFFHFILKYSIWSGIKKFFFQIRIFSTSISTIMFPEIHIILTLVLSFTLKKMIKGNNIVRNKDICETLGEVNFICTDKTGILTSNKMKVVSFYNNKDKINLDDLNNIQKFTEKFYKHLKDALINNIDIICDEKGDIISNSSKTDYAFYDLLKGFKENLKEKYKQIDRLKFNDDRKRMSTIIKRDDGKYFIYMKGNPEEIIKACTNYLEYNGEEIIDIQKDPNYLKSLEEVIKEYSNLALRSIAISYKEISIEEVNQIMESKINTLNPNYDIEQTGFTLIGVAALEEFIKPGIPQSINFCRKADIKVIMITSDNISVAESFAKKCGIIREKGNLEILTGNQFMERIGGIICKTYNMNMDKCSCPKTFGQAKVKFGDLNEEDLLSKMQKEGISNMDAFEEIIQNLKVIANAKPKDKYALILELKELGFVVSMAGDSANDKNALTKADISFSMRNIGTDIAKESSDIIIKDDNFNSIIHSIKLGRNIFNNERKVIQFQYSTIFSFSLLMFFCSIIKGEIPFSIIQIFWIYLIINFLGSFALLSEEPNDDILYRKTHAEKEKTISYTMWKMIIVQSLIQFVLVFYLYLYGNHFIIEDNQERINIMKQIQNCFNDFPIAKTEIINNTLNYYIMEGKKSSWISKKILEENNTSSKCFFFDRTQFKENQITDLSQVIEWYISTYGNTAHMTIIFNTFVLYLIFNQINSRIINNNLNIFYMILDNKIFIVATSIEIFIQFLMVQYGGKMFKCNNKGLTFSQWKLCLYLASISFLVNFCIKFIRLETIFEGNGKKGLSLEQKNKELKHNNNKGNENSID